MSEPLTRPSLIARLHDAEDAEAWTAFVEIYQPLLERIVRRWGLQPADAAEITQEVLAAVLTRVGDFEMRKQCGAFRGWLATIARNKLVDFVRSRDRDLAGRGGTDFRRWLEEQPASCDERASGQSRWDLHARRAVFAWAAAKVRQQVHERTWAAFQQTAIEGRSAAEVARELDADVGWVYVARSRVLARLRRTVATWDESLTQSPEKPDAV